LKAEHGYRKLSPECYALYFDDDRKILYEKGDSNIICVSFITERAEGYGTAMNAMLLSYTTYYLLTYYTFIQPIILVRSCGTLIK
jgi:hypothetical protein